VRSSAAAGSGHPTSSMSAADLMAVLLYPPDSEFPTGGSRVPRFSPDDQVTVVAAGAQPRRGQGTSGER
jgi:hypothetical protein